MRRLLPPSREPRQRDVSENVSPLKSVRLRKRQLCNLLRPFMSIIKNGIDQPARIKFKGIRKWPNNNSVLKVLDIILRTLYSQLPFTTTQPLPLLWIFLPLYGNTADGWPLISRNFQALAHKIVSKVRRAVWNLLYYVTFQYGPVDLISRQYIMSI